MRLGAEVLAGTVKEILTFRPDDGRLALRVEGAGPGGRVETVLSPRAPLVPGARAVFRGRWQVRDHLGRHFLADHVEVGLPAERSEVIRFLASGLFPGIGYRRAELLASRFGPELWEVVRTEPERLRAAGIGPKTAETLRKTLAETEAAWATLRRLQAAGADPVLARPILEAFGPDAPARLDGDPYALVGLVPGFGFDLAEKLGRGRPELAQSRRAAWTVHLLQRAADEEGHCYLPLPELFRRCGNRLRRETLVGAIREAIASGRVRYEAVGSGRLYLTALHDAEEAVARNLAGRLADTEPVRVEGRVAALELLSAARVAVLTGGPGVGKTRLVADLLARPALRGRRVMLAAPTGRAARRLEAATRRPAFTIHRLLEYQPEAGRFRRGPESPIDADLVVVDEVSMLDILLAEKLLAALSPDTRLLLVGDPAQIPSVGPGNLLADLLASGVVPVARLTEVQRQAADSGIVVNAYRVLSGETPADGSADFGVFEARSAAEVVDRVGQLVAGRIGGLSGPGQGIQVLAAKYGGPAGVDRLNERLQQLINPAVPGWPQVTWKGRQFRPGDRVVQQVNNYARGVANGEIGRVIRVDPGGPELQVEFETAFGPWTVTYRGPELDELDLAYALTIHKSQGSDYPAVVIVAVRDHLPLLDRRLLYTAITRARRWCLIVAEPGVLAEVVRTEQARHRHTALAERLRTSCGCP